MKTIIVFLIVATFYCLPRHEKIKDLYFLTGTWKMEHTENYETWSITDSGALEGSSYSIKEGNKMVSEYLTIKAEGEKIIYTAAVTNQNNGLPIDFVWNKEVKDKFSFENIDHDFPKKVQYKKLNDTIIFIEVLGERNKGFSYRLLKANK